jgi:CDGSH-type Zn-finger protein/uncharacterized Fe-S cluster protein YjdI
VGPSTRRYFSERLGELSRAAEKLAESGDPRCIRATRVFDSLRQQALSGFSMAPVLSQAPAFSLSQAPLAPPATIPAPGPTTVPAPPTGPFTAAPPSLLPSLQPSISGAPPVPATPLPIANDPTTVGTLLTLPPPSAAASVTPVPPTQQHLPTPPTPVVIDGVDHIEGRDMTLLYEGKRCIHARFCVTGGPKVFLANVPGPWIQPDAARVDHLVEIAHACPSGAIRYLRKDAKPNEAPPQVNLLAVREAGPYAVRADVRMNGQSGNYRFTLCRCGASKNKPFCDGSHHEVAFSATGEPATGKADMLPTRDGPLDIQPEPDGPLRVRGNLEITSGTGRVVVRLTQARLCRCGGSSNKPFCDGTHARIGFRST